MTPQLIYNHSIEDSDIHNLCEDLVQYSDIAPKYYERFDVKRGLRNADGSGVIAGITRICIRLRDERGRTPADPRPAHLPRL